MHRREIACFVRRAGEARDEAIVRGNEAAAMPHPDAS